VKILWSVPVRGEGLESSRGDLVRANFLIQGLRRLGHEVTVVEYSGKADAQIAVNGYRKLIRRIFPKQPALILRDAGRWLHSRSFGTRLARTAREIEADVLVETQVAFSISGSVAAQHASIPLILDDCSPSSEEIEFGAGIPSLAHHVLRKQAVVASFIITITESARSLLVHEGITAEKMRIVRNGVDLPAYDATDRAGIRRELGLGEECILVFAGSFQFWHRTKLLVETLAEMKSAKDNVRLLLIGDGPDLQPSLEYAHRLHLSEKIISVGAVASTLVPGYLSACDIGVLAGSNDYGQPMKLLEYAAAGLPSVAPDLGPVREILEHDVTGLLFPPNDLKAFCDALIRLIDDAPLRRNIGTTARHRASQESWETKALLFSEIIREAIQMKRRHESTEYNPEI